MFDLNKFFIKQSEAGDGDGGGSGGGAGGAGDTPPGGGGVGTSGDDKGGDDIQAQLKALREEKDAMKAKMDELLSETKTAKAARRAAEEQARIESEQKAKQAGDYEQLYKSSEEKVTGLTTELEKLRNSVTSEKKETAVLRIAGELADGVDAENLAALIGNRLKYHEGEIKVLNEKGELTVSTIDDFKNEIKSTPRFKSLLKGSQATGGSATGNRASGATTKTATRAEFDAMNHGARSKFFADGGKVIQS